MFLSRTLLLLVLATNGCAKSGSNDSSARSDGGSANPCAAPLAIKFKPSLTNNDFDCNLNLVTFVTFSSETERKKEIGFGEFKGLSITLSDDHLDFPTTIMVELDRRANGRVWGIALDSENMLPHPISVTLPKNARNLIPHKYYKKHSLSLSTADGRVATLLNENVSVTLLDTQPSDSSASNAALEGESSEAGDGNAETTDETLNYRVKFTLKEWGLLLPSPAVRPHTPSILSDMAPKGATEDTPFEIEIPYADLENDLATSCFTSVLDGIFEEAACKCDEAGVCIVTVQGLENFFGDASLKVAVESDDQLSNIADINFKIAPVDDAPEGEDVDKGRINQDVKVIATLAYSDIEGDLAKTCIITSLDNLVVTSPCTCDGDGVCQVEVSSPLGKSGPASISYSVSTGELSSLPAKLTYLIDDVPTTSDFTYEAIDEDMTEFVPLSYTDKNGDLGVSCSVSSPSNIGFTTDCSCDTEGVCGITAQGTQDFFGMATFEFTVTTRDLESDPSTATVKIDPIDDNPEGVAFIDNTAQEDVASVIVLQYTDVEGDLATDCTTSAPENLTLENSNNCSCDGSGVCSVTIKGTPEHFNGAASFKFTVLANNKLSTVETATINIQPVDDAPVADDLTAGNAPPSFDEDVESIITLSYSDVDPDLATSCSVTPVANVSVTTACSCDGAGVCTVGLTGSPLHHNGVGSATYTVSSNALTSNVASIDLTIDPVDDAPEGQDFTGPTFLEDTQSPSITLLHSDVESDAATLCAITPDANITETLACACVADVCTVKVTGIQDYNGSASFTYTVTANGLTSAAKTVTLTITNVDDAPVADDLTAGTAPADFNEDEEAIITLSYTDVDLDNATVCAVTPDANTTITTACSCTAGVCTVGITGVLNYNGAASFAYTVTANSVVSNSATADLTILAVDDKPVAKPLTGIDAPAAFDEDTESIITLDYTDVEGDLATACNLPTLNNVTVTTACSCDVGGVCTVGVTGTLHHNNGFATSGFTYTVTANTLVSDAVAADLTIDPINDFPVANDMTVTFDEDVTYTLTLDYDEFDAEDATACSTTALSGVQIVSACSCTSGVCTVQIKSNPEHYNGGASLDFDITAGGETATDATVTITIDPVDDAPVANDLTAGTAPGSFDEDTEEIITFALASEYTDEESDKATSCTIYSLTNVTVTTACSCTDGTCSVGVTGSPLHYNGAASFKYTVTSNGLESNQADVDLTIDPVDDPPVSNHITPSSFDEDTELMITLNYTDVDPDLATACTISAETNVTVTTACTCDGSGVCTVGVTGSPLHYFGDASFKYTVTANSVISNISNVTLTIDPVDDAPTTSNQNFTIAEDITWTVPFGWNDVESDDPDECEITNLTNLAQVVGCVCSDDGGGLQCKAQLKGTPADYFGTASVDFRVKANGLWSNWSTYSLPLNNVHDAVDVNETIDEDTEEVLTLSYDDGNGLADSCEVLGTPDNIEVKTACSCTGAGVCTIGVQATPEHWNGSTSVNYRLNYTTDALTVDGISPFQNDATVNITVDNINDLPVTISFTHDVAGVDPYLVYEDVEEIIYFRPDGASAEQYFDADGDLANTCTIKSVTNVAVSTACSCDGSGVCSVGVKSDPEHTNGAASFTYTVTTLTDESNISTVDFTLIPVDDAPFANDFSPPSFDEDTATIITLDYTDVENDLGTACTISELTNVRVTTPCACDGAGVCTVEVISDPEHYFGAASFDFTITANTLTSNPAGTATLTIDPINDAPTLDTNEILEVPFNETEAVPVSLLDTNDVDDADSDLTYTITTDVTRGTLKLSGVPITVGSTFTHQDIVSGLVTYVHTDVDIDPDFFEFSVKDDAPLFAATATTPAPARFNIQINPLDVDCNDYLSETLYDAVGTGTTGAPYQLCTVQQLVSLADSGCNSSTGTGCAKNFRLQTNIDMSSSTNFGMIGSSTYPFVGSFNGNGYQLSNLSISYSGNYVGFFRYIGTNGTVSNVILDGTVTGEDHVGAIAGYNLGSISKSGFTGSVTSSGSANVGALVGYLTGSISNSYGRATVNGGGSGVEVGGLVGYVQGGSITNSYANGSVTNGSNIGGLVGKNNSGVYTCNFWDSTATGQSNAYFGSSGDAGGIEGKTSALMKNASTFNCGSSWDFGGTWKSYENVAAPRLLGDSPLLDCQSNGSFADTDGDTNVDACYYPALAACESGTGMGVDSDLNGVLDSCIFKAADNATCTSTCTGNAEFTLFDLVETKALANVPAVCKSVFDMFDTQNYTIDIFADSIFNDGTNVMREIGCSVATHPYLLSVNGAPGVVIAAPPAEIDPAIPSGGHNFIQNSGVINRACGCKK